ncbi:hypothetical protein D3C73_332010 [compost metagenome]
MNVYEMEVFLCGKCMPRDILVNESTAEYLVRKLNEETTVKADRDAQQKRVDALAVENSALKNFCKNAAFDADYESELCMDRGGFTDAFNNIETPATDAALAAIEARGVEKFADFLDSPIDGRHCYQHEVGLARHFASTLREAK